MQGLRLNSNDIVHLNPMPPPPPPSKNAAACGGSSRLSIDEAETTEAKIQRLISEHPVIIFGRSTCCMCHVMKQLLATIGVHPTVIQLDDDEIASLPTATSDGTPLRNPTPAVFIGGACVGGLESLVALHLGGHLVPKLVEIGALYE